MSGTGNGSASDRMAASISARTDGQSISACRVSRGPGGQSPWSEGGELLVSPGDHRVDPLVAWTRHGPGTAPRRV